MKIKERTPDDLDAAELAAILRGCVSTKVPWPSEERAHNSQELLREMLRAGWHGGLLEAEGSPTPFVLRMRLEAAARARAAAR